MSERRELDPEQAAIVLEQIVDYSSDADIREHVRQVVTALRSTGFIVVDGPPQQAMREAARGTASSHNRQEDR
jgi:hypothetical protein